MGIMALLTPPYLLSSQEAFASKSDDDDHYHGKNTTTQWIEETKSHQPILQLMDNFWISREIVNVNNEEFL